MGTSKFYDVGTSKESDSPSTPQSPKEKQDHMKPTDSDEEGGNTYFRLFPTITNF